MGNKIKNYGKKLVFVTFVLAAGCSYSCRQKDAGVSLSEIQTSVASDQEKIDVFGEKADAGSQPSGEADLPDDREAMQESQSGSCFVHVCGEVEKPGVYELREGQRVYEAIGQAGGFTSQAADSYLNLAETVTDGMKLLVPNRDDMQGVLRADLAEKDSQPSKVNLNTASKEELMTLRGIGESRAEDIIRYREKQDGFSCIEDIMNIPGIKDAAFQKIKEDITV